MHILQVEDQINTLRVNAILLSFQKFEIIICELILDNDWFEPRFSKIRINTISQRRYQ